jgi:ankyrin repeat protein
VNAGADADHVDKNGQTPLYYAIKGMKLDVIEFLLQTGVNVHRADKKGSTYLA